MAKDKNQRKTIETQSKHNPNIKFLLFFIEGAEGSSMMFSFHARFFVINFAKVWVNEENIFTFL